MQKSLYCRKNIGRESITRSVDIAADGLDFRDIPSRVRVLGRVLRHYSDSAESEY